MIQCITDDISSQNKIHWSSNKCTSHNSTGIQPL